MGFSGFYHNYGTMNSETMWKYRKMDYVGIIIMIGGSCTSPFYYANMCRESLFYAKLFIG